MIDYDFHSFELEKISGLPSAEFTKIVQTRHDAVLSNADKISCASRSALASVERLAMEISVAARVVNETHHEPEGTSGALKFHTSIQILQGKQRAFEEVWTELDEIQSAIFAMEHYAKIVFDLFGRRCERWRATVDHTSTEASDTLEQEKKSLETEHAKILAKFERPNSNYTADNPSNKQVREAVWNMTDGQCIYCDIQTQRDPEATMEPTAFRVEHVVPRVCGGPNHLKNYAPACHACNMKKSDKHLVQFIKELRARFSVSPTGEARLERFKEGESAKRWADGC